MNLEDLISKYLDGELNEEEDLLLRSKISEDSSVKILFDTAIHIHSACREDAESIQPPKNLVSATEDKILMKILSQQPVVVEQRFWKQRVYLQAAVVAFLMFVSLFNISDLKQFTFKPFISKFEINNKSIDNSRNDGTANKETVVRRATGRNNETNIAADAITATDKQNESIAAIINNNVADNSPSDAIADKPTAVNSEYAAIKPTPAINEMNTNESSRTIIESPEKKTGANSKVVEPDKPVNTFNSVRSSAALQNENSGAVKDEPNLNSAFNRTSAPWGFNAMDILSESNDVQMNSFFGTDLIRGGIHTSSKQMITHFSQSIGYSINEHEKIGLEAGYTEYEYTENGKVTIPLYDNRITSKKIESNNGMNFTPGSSLYMTTNFSYGAQKQIFWGAAFFEHSFIKTDDLSVNGRLGIGASGDGLLSYGRVYGRYNLFKFLAITIGTEGRLFSVSMPKNDENTNSLKGCATLIYGFQINF